MFCGERIVSENEEVEDSGHTRCESNGEKDSLTDDRVEKMRDQDKIIC